MTISTVRRTSEGGDLVVPVVPRIEMDPQGVAVPLSQLPSLAGLADGSVAVGAAGVGTSPVAVAASTSFIPFQTIWLLELTCSDAGSAVVTLSGVRRDDATTETVATYSLAAEETLVDANDRTDHVSFSWTKTGAGAVTARVL